LNPEDSNKQDGGKLLTPGEAAQQLRVTPEHVRSLIRQGLLAAVNVGTGAKRPLYRIAAEALREFMSCRGQSGPRARPRRPKRRPSVRDHFPDLR
jgi:excisionase family DNA binding protein